MTTPLDKPLRREVQVGKARCTPTIDPSGLKLVEEGRCNRLSLARGDLVNGDAALVAALRAATGKGQR